MDDFGNPSLDISNETQLRAFVRFALSDRDLVDAPDASLRYYGLIAVKYTRIPVTELKAGMVVHAHGARFEIREAKVVKDTYRGEVRDVGVARAKWLNGHIEVGYFGPTKDWTFQGTSVVTVSLEQ